MDGYLLETSLLSALLDSRHVKHVTARATVESFDSSALKYVSVIAIGELVFGQRLIEAFAGSSPRVISEVIRQAETHSILDVTRHTAREYGELKCNLAKTYLEKAIRNDRPRWLENWIDKATGQTLQVDENDLWMCAQARERNLILVTADAKMVRISTADPAVRIKII